MLKQFAFILVILICLFFGFTRQKLELPVMREIKEDYENNEGGPQVTDADSYNGSYSTFVDSRSHFSSALVIPLKDFSSEKVFKVKFSAYFKKRSANIYETGLAFKGENRGGTSIFWNFDFLDDDLDGTVNEWVFVEKEWILNRNFDPADSFVFFVGNGKGIEEVLMDKVRVKIY